MNRAELERLCTVYLDGGGRITRCPSSGDLPHYSGEKNPYWKDRTTMRERWAKQYAKRRAMVKAAKGRG